MTAGRIPRRKRPATAAKERELLIAAINRVVEREGSELDPFWVAVQAMVLSKDKSWSDD